MLASHIETGKMRLYQRNVHLKRNVAEDISQRQKTFKYHLPVNGKAYNVSQKTVLDVFQISSRRVQTLHTKIKINLEISDKTGTHHNRPCTVSFDVKELVTDHISSMPAQENHYSRSTSRKLYLNSELCVERMYDLSKESHPYIKCLHSLYSDIFRSEFKLRFCPPRSDSCSICDELYINIVAAETEDEQKMISAQSTLHHRKAETAYKVLHKDDVMSKSNPTYVVLCTDMKQIVVSHKTITGEKFLDSGHSYFTCDKDFALIERRKNKSTVYCPKQWLEVIVNASPAFSAYCIDKEGFIDLAVIEGMFKKQPDFKITSFHWIQFSSEEPNTVRTRVRHNTLPTWHSYVIWSLPRERKYLRPLPTILPQLYEETIAIKKAKRNTC
ncbi:hypothetical protein PR048_005068 [Dryococelus australis]|uniref:Uncharacterized protein n=1 Tax=Dryococelus australis TaxID=614101 RepID=A0ABQ9I764_9NEOP|nr:hypothetical protein PR048_005068 [Dryococelus australis]